MSFRNETVTGLGSTKCYNQTSACKLRCFSDVTKINLTHALFDETHSDNISECNEWRALCFKCSICSLIASCRFNGM